MGCRRETVEETRENRKYWRKKNKNGKMFGVGEGGGVCSKAVCFFLFFWTEFF